MRQVQGAVRDAPPRANLLYSPRKRSRTSPLIEPPVRGARAAASACATSTSPATSPITARSATRTRPVDIDFGDAPIAMRNPPPWRLQEVQSRHRGVDVLPERDRPCHDQATKSWMIDWGQQGAANGVSVGQDDPRRKAQTGGRRRRWHGAVEGAGHPLHQQADARRSAEAHVARALTSRRRVVPTSRYAQGHRRIGRRILFSGCGSSGSSRRWGWRRRRCCTTSAHRRCCRWYLCCGYPQTSAGKPRRRTADHHFELRPVPPRGEHAQLPDIRRSSSCENAWTSCRNTSSTRSSRLPAA